MRYVLGFLCVCALGLTSLLGCSETTGTGGDGGTGGDAGTGGTAGIDVPPAPDLEPLLQAYANPTAVVGSQIMSEVADEIAKAAEEIQNSEIFDEILQVIIDVQQELDAATVKTCDGGAMNGSDCSADADCPDGTCVSTGDIVVGGICDGGANEGDDCTDDTDCPGDPDAGIDPGTCAVRINYICPGWDERQFDEGYDAQPDSSNGAIDLFMTVESGGIGRVVWGTADQCLYLVPNEGDDCEAARCSEASYDGGVALDLGPDWVSEDISELPVTFLMEGDIRFDGGAYRIHQSFRVTLAVESRLTILVDIGYPALTETFNYIFAADAQAIRDATGLFGCSLEESRCFEQTCEGGANDGNVCIANADCPEGTCERREAFSW